MIIKEMFAKPIDRDIKGVIKVGQDDDSNIKQELSEYVVTRELQKHFREFFDSYKRGITGNTDKMGVWISGFFGSGKSHFLKILSYILRNKSVDGKNAIDYFIEDNKINDPMVLADMKLAATVPTDAILFNIDSKSESTGKDNNDAIVSVFLKVFNEMQGFCSNNFALADLERRLTDEGKYDDFRSSFENSYGEKWEDARHEFDFIQDDVIDALVDIGYMSAESARSWSDKALEPYSISIEDFAKLVKKYIDKKGGNHHVVFLVDEVGQYIGDNSKLMLNLQTVTEELGTACRGKAWIVVTSQQDIDSITKIKGNDFSKIQGRFDTRLSLSSANVDEVIKKRILEKNEAGNATLSALYDTKDTVIKNLILFNDGVEKKLYESNEDFALVYPFIPYQFNLLGSVLTSIRTHGASGKHLAEGERSMLALFKESAVKLMNKEPGALVPFNMFYDALEQFLDHSHKGVISKALDNTSLNPDHADECFEVNVLKTLFMIKYVKEIKANVNNIASLMVSDIDEDRLVLCNRVEEALNRLIRQTLVQKNGDIYVFLTNEEQEINRAIDAQPIESSEVIAKVSSMIFDDIYPENKYRLSTFNNRYQFSFCQFVDDHPFKANQNFDIKMRILTPNSDEIGDASTLRLSSGQDNSVLVVLPNDRAFLDEITSVLKIEKFLRNDAANTATNTETLKDQKRTEIRDRTRNAKTYLCQALEKADIYTNGSDVKTSTTDIKNRLNEALGKLINSVYHKLTYITRAVGEDDIRALLRDNSQQISIDGTKADFNVEARKDMSSYISDKTSQHLKVSMKSLMERFTKAPYGYVEADVQWLVAKLFHDGEIALTVNNEQVTFQSKTSEEIYRFITRKEFIDKLMVEKRVKASDNQKKVVREVMKSLFNTTPNSEDDDAIMSSFISYAEKLKEEIEKTEYNYNGGTNYPGRRVLSDGKRLLTDICDIKYPAEFFATVSSKKEDLLDLADDYEPVKKFFAGQQKGIFDNAVKLMSIYEDSKSFIVNADIESYVQQVNAILKKSEPYNDMHKLPGLLEKYSDVYNKMLDEQLEPALNAIEDARKRVFDELDGKECKPKLSDKYIQSFADLVDKAKAITNVASLKNIPVEADTLKTRFLNEIDVEERKIADEKARKAAIAAQSANNTTGASGSSDATTPVPAPEPVPVKKVKKRKAVSIKTLNTSNTWQLESSEDVEKYISELKTKLMNTLEDDTIITIEF